MSAPRPPHQLPLAAEFVIRRLLAQSEGQHTMVSLPDPVSAPRMPAALGIAAESDRGASPEVQPPMPACARTSPPSAWHGARPAGRRTRARDDGDCGPGRGHGAAPGGRGQHDRGWPVVGPAALRPTPRSTSVSPSSNSNAGPRSTERSSPSSQHSASSRSAATPCSSDHPGSARTASRSPWASPPSWPVS